MKTYKNYSTITSSVHHYKIAKVEIKDGFNHITLDCKGSPIIHCDEEIGFYARYHEMYNKLDVTHIRINVEIDYQYDIYLFGNILLQFKTPFNLSTIDFEKYKLKNYGYNDCDDNRDGFYKAFIRRTVLYDRCNYNYITYLFNCLVSKYETMTSIKKNHPRYDIVLEKQGIDGSDENVYLVTQDATINGVDIQDHICRWAFVVNEAISLIHNRFKK